MAVCEQRQNVRQMYGECMYSMKNLVQFNYMYTYIVVQLFPWVFTRARHAIYIYALWGRAGRLYIPYLILLTYNPQMISYVQNVMVLGRIESLQVLNRSFKYFCSKQFH